MKKSIYTLFWRNIKERRNGCWEWTGVTVNRNSSPVPVVWNGGQYVSTANRVSFKLHGKKLTDSPLRHSCDNSVCVNPDHLYLPKKVRR